MGVLDGIDKSTTTLKPCPFCGGEPRNIGMYEGLAQVICPHCDFAATDSEVSEEDAIRLWNTRKDNSK